MPGAIAEDAHLRSLGQGCSARPAPLARLNVREARRAAEPGDQQACRTPGACTASKRLPNGIPVVRMAAAYMSRLTNECITYNVYK